MRKNIYRGWSEKVGLLEPGKFKVGSDVDGVLNGFIFDDDDVPIHLELTQYIGINDKKGKMIFENDIVKLKKRGMDFTGVVKFSNGAFWILAKNGSVCIHFFTKLSKLEVIGNTYERW